MARKSEPPADLIVADPEIPDDFRRRLELFQGGYRAHLGRLRPMRRCCREASAAMASWMPAERRKHDGSP